MLLGSNALIGQFRRVKDIPREGKQVDHVEDYVHDAFLIAQCIEKIK
jgi:hypothetical protein